MNGGPRRIAVVMPTIFEQVTGGSEYQCYLLADRAKTEGMEVHYIFVDNGRPCDNRLDLALHPLKSIRLRKTLGAYWSLYFGTVHRLLKGIRPDVVYVRGGWSFAGMTAWYAKRRECKSIWHVAHVEDVTPPPFLSLLRRPFDLIERKAIEYAIRHSTHVVSQAQFQDDLLRRHYGRASEVILQFQPQPKEVLHKNDPFTVVWVANIKAWKQPEMFIRLARELGTCENVRFLMIGRPAGVKYQEELEAQIRALSNLEYLGEQPIERVNAILAESHVFVNTSTHEGFANTFVQAWMREVPVVSMLLDPDNILKKRKVGYFSGSFEQMARDVRRLIENPALRDEMGRRAREYAMENHSLEKNMGRLLELIRS